MFKDQLELKDGTPAGDYTAAAPNRTPGDIPLGAERSLRVIEVRQGVLVVESP